MEEDKKPKVHFGSSGPDEKKPRLKMGSFGSASSAAIMEGIQAGNINISDGNITIVCPVSYLKTIVGVQSFTPYIILSGILWNTMFIS